MPIIEKSFYLLSLGCPKNQVDAECMSALLQQRGFLAVAEPDQAEILLVNTCGFIESAKREAIDHILALADYTAADDRQRCLVVTGCLAQRYAAEILQEFPEVALVLGTGEYHLVVDRIEAWRQRRQRDLTLPGAPGSLAHLNVLRRPASAFGYAYVKIAEGCSNHCSYCAIPSIRGPLRSRPLPELVAEVIRLTDAGYDEIILVAQDTTRYGQDLADETSLLTLLQALVRIEKVRLIRLMYVYADAFPLELIHFLRDEPKLAKYLDLPIQHASDRILRRMNRRDTQAGIRQLVQTVRATIPGVILRTTVLVGFPGETEADFQELLAFLREMRFDRLGCFAFSAEEGTAAALMDNAVPQSVADARVEQVMLQQQAITAERNRSRIGQCVTIRLESIAADGILYEGRSYGEAPDVDPVVLVAAAQPDVELGQLAQVRLIDVVDYELIGVTLDESAE